MRDYVCVGVCICVYPCTAHKKRCRFQVEEYLGQLGADVRADIQRELATLLRDLEEKNAYDVGPPGSFLKTDKPNPEKVCVYC